MVLCGTGGLAVSAAAQGNTDRSAYTPLMMGEDLSQIWCNACHVIGAGPNENALDAAPPFPTLAPLVRADPDRYRAFLIAPHTDDMRGMSFSREEIEGLLAYIQSLY